MRPVSSEISQTFSLFEAGPNFLHCLFGMQGPLLCFWDSCMMIWTVWIFHISTQSLSYLMGCKFEGHWGSTEKFLSTELSFVLQLLTGSLEVMIHILALKKRLTNRSFIFLSILFVREIGRHEPFFLLFVYLRPKFKFLPLKKNR